MQACMCEWMSVYIFRLDSCTTVGVCTFLYIYIYIVHQMYDILNIHHPRDRQWALRGYIACYESLSLSRFVSPFEYRHRLMLTLGGYGAQEGATQVYTMTAQCKHVNPTLGFSLFMAKLFTYQWIIQASTLIQFGDSLPSSHMLDNDNLVCRLPTSATGCRSFIPFRS